MFSFIRKLDAGDVHDDGLLGKVEITMPPGMEQGKKPRKRKRRKPIAVVADPSAVVAKFNPNHDAKGEFASGGGFAPGVDDYAASHAAIAGGIPDGVAGAAHQIAVKNTGLLNVRDKTDEIAKSVASGRETYVGIQWDKKYGGNTYSIVKKDFPGAVLVNGSSNAAVQHALHRVDIENATNSFSHAWSRDSQLGLSDSLQEAVAKTYGVRGLSREQLLDATGHSLYGGARTGVTGSSDKFATAYAKSVYEHTQAGLAGSGPMTLYRGISGGSNDERPLSSWTTDRSIAESFAKGGEGTPMVKTATVPVSDIFSVGGHGPGATSEKEVIVMNRPGHHIQIDVQKFNPNHDQRGEFSSGPGGAAASAKSFLNNPELDSTAQIQANSDQTKAMLASDGGRNAAGAYEFSAGSDSDYSKMKDAYRPDAQKALGSSGAIGAQVDLDGDTLQIHPVTSGWDTSRPGFFSNMSEYNSAVDSATYYNAVGHITDAWGWSSTKGRFSSALQHSTSSTLSPTATRFFDSTKLSPSQQAFMNQFVHTQYSRTQSALAAHGIKEVTLYRGLNVDEGLETGKVRLDSMPLNSYTVKADAARSFALGRTSGLTDGQAYMFKAKVPAKDIFSAGGNGLGFASLGEVVVLGDQTGTMSEYGKIKKFNPNHDSHGEFASGAGGHFTVGEAVNAGDRQQTGLVADRVGKSIGGTHATASHATVVSTNNFSHDSISGQYSIKNRTIQIRPDGGSDKNRGFTLAHEYGHAMDAQEFGHGRFGSVTSKNPDMKAVRSALEASPEYKTWSNGHNAAYWSSPQEMFARGYAQWLAGKTGEKYLTNGVTDGQKKGEQWSHENFKPIAAAYDKLFKTASPHGGGVAKSIVEDDMITPFAPEELDNKSHEELVQGYIALGLDDDAAEAYTNVLEGKDEKTEEPVVEPVAKVAFVATIEKALEIGKAVGHDDFIAEVHYAAAEGADRIVIEQDSNGDIAVAPYSPAPIAKAVEEQRYTLAPVYIPGQYDAHGDHATADDLQKAMWDFQRGDKLIALQHRPDLGPMGEAVEMMVVPWEHDVPMQKADGSTYNQHFPANTPWMGVVWREEVWPLVKQGLANGYSIGGKASLLDVDLPGAADAIAKARDSE